MLWAIIIAFFVGGTVGMALICLLAGGREFRGESDSWEEIIIK